MFSPMRLGHVTGFAIAMLLAHPAIFAEDIDIFVGGTGAQTAKPNILFVLDNSANWSRNDQHWLPKGTSQGQAEARAIRNALGGLTGKVNVGLMMYVTQGSQNDNAYVRHAIKELNTTNQSALNTKLDRIYNNINAPDEKRQSGPKYGYLMHDVYNYLAGRTSLDSGTGTPSGLADASGYQTSYSRFSSPLTTADLCTDTYLVFIGNPQSSGPSTDDSSNSNALSALVTAAGGTADRLAGSGSGTPLPIPKFTLNRQTEVESLGLSKDCYNNQNSCTSAVNAAGSDCLNAGYSSCVCLSTKESPRDNECGNQDRYMVEGTIINETMVPTGDFDTSKGRDWNLDDWSKFLYVQGCRFRVQRCPIHAPASLPIPSTSSTRNRTTIIPVS
ncbi:hypothetical protein [Thiocapsa sp.]|uniref:hypothetical protein n=1 Tax=Thiocapsa sp. TaxID=2024551 RepID=UPI0026333045|nr:hypothetical protein [Thiocapsa sp.]